MSGTRRSILTADEKTVLRHSRALGLPVAIAMLRREVERQPVQHSHEDDEDRDIVDRQLQPSRTPSGYVTK